MGRRTKPCPGCGKSPEGMRLWPAGGVCHECETLIAEAKKARELRASQRKRYDFVLVNTPGVNYGGDTSRLLKVEDAFRDAIIASFSDNVIPFTAAGKHVKLFDNSETHNADDYAYRPSNHDYYGDGHLMTVIRIPRGARKALNHFKTLLNKWLETVEAKERAAGASLLERLAAGEITVDEFNKYSGQG